MGQIKKKVERIPITEDLSSKLSLWERQVSQHPKGKFIKKREIIDFLLNRNPESLPQKLLNELCDSFFDEVKYLADALSMAKKARKSGEKTTAPNILLSSLRPAKKPSKPKPLGASKEKKDASLPQKSPLKSSLSENK